MSDIHAHKGYTIVMRSRREHDEIQAVITKDGWVYGTETSKSAASALGLARGAIDELVNALGSEPYVPKVGGDFTGHVNGISQTITGVLQALQALFVHDGQAYGLRVQDETIAEMQLLKNSTGDLWRILNSGSLQIALSGTGVVLTLAQSGKVTIGLGGLDVAGNLAGTSGAGMTISTTAGDLSLNPFGSVKWGKTYIVDAGSPTGFSITGQLDNSSQAFRFPVIPGA